VSTVRIAQRLQLGRADQRTAKPRTAHR
jgi:hypothetical protein